MRHEGRVGVGDGAAGPVAEVLAWWGINGLGERASCYQVTPNAASYQEHSEMDLNDCS